MTCGYLQLVHEILVDGVDSLDRTGVGTKKVFGRTLTFDLANGFPALTTRKVAPRIAFEELMWMLRGDTSAKTLQHKKIHIWDGNTTKDFQQKVGLGHLPEGDIGKGYGFQMRNFNGHSAPESGDYNAWSRELHGGIDQLTAVFNSLKTDPTGRRHIMSYWNPAQLDQAVLPPCHLYCQFVVVGDELNLAWVQRSVDVIYGLPYNMMFYAMLLEFFAKALRYKAGKLMFTGMDVHIYNNQLEIATEQCQRLPKTLPTLVIKKDLQTLGDILSLEFTDLAVEGYDPHPDFRYKPPMAV